VRHRCIRLVRRGIGVRAGPSVVVNARSVHSALEIDVSVTKFESAAR
jgi:hypothetical protein